MPKSYSSREIIKFIEEDGWYWTKTAGSHNHYKHPTKPGKATVPHPNKTIYLETQKSIEKQTGLKFK